MARFSIGGRWADPTGDLKSKDSKLSAMDEHLTKSFVWTPAPGDPVGGKLGKSEQITDASQPTYFDSSIHYMSGVVTSLFFPRNKHNRSFLLSDTIRVSLYAVHFCPSARQKLESPCNMHNCVQMDHALV